MIYLNHSAASYPKRPAVLKALSEAAAAPEQQFRSTMQNGPQALDQLRGDLSRLLGVSGSGNIYFTSGATESLNTLFFGLGYPSEAYLTTAAEHNSVLRPLFNLDEGSPAVAACNSEGLVTVASLEKVLRPESRVLVIGHCSNVTGAIPDMAAISDFAHAHGLLLVIDASQSAGSMTVCGDLWKADAIVFTGQKALGGLSGTGGFYLRKGIPLKPLKYGGTGRDSRRLIYTDTFEYEVGTQNLPGLLALAAAVREILQQDPAQIHIRELALRDHLILKLKEIPGIRLYGASLENAGPLISLTMEKLDPEDLGYMLFNGYDIVTRSGLQCAPLIHRYLGTESKGVLRISFSADTTLEELDALAAALSEIGGALDENH